MYNLSKSSQFIIRFCIIYVFHHSLGPEIIHLKVSANDMISLLAKLHYTYFLMSLNSLLSLLCKPTLMALLSLISLIPLLYIYITFS